MRIWIHGARPTTLVLSISSVVMGVAVSLSAFRSVSGMNLTWRFWSVAVLCLLVGISFQVAVNYANDYSDGIRGTDVGRTGDGECGESEAPYRLTASGTVRPKAVLKAAAFSAGFGCICGIAIVIVTGNFWLLLIGAASVLAAWFYTGGKHPYGYEGLGELAVFIFFGLAAVLGTQWAITGGVSVLGVVVAVIAGLVSIASMMVNNIRDVEEDEKNDKWTLEVRIGGSRSLSLFNIIYIAPLCIVTLVLFYVFSKQLTGNVISIPTLAFVFAAAIIGVIVVCLACKIVENTRKRNYSRALKLSSAVSALTALGVLLLGIAL
jgi:1,4-dihydroxy-2-naphthoate octaprenyltransferase